MANARCLFQFDDKGIFALRHSSGDTAWVNLPRRFRRRLRIPSAGTGVVSCALNAGYVVATLPRAKARRTPYMEPTIPFQAEDFPVSKLRGKP
jgi:hypothetical protein